VPLLVLAFVVVPLVELYVIIQVGGAIGVLPTIGLLLADSVLGSLLMRSQGRAAWRSFTRATTEGRVPAREVLDGALIIFGGALLLTPGFVTDLLGMALLVPPTRAVVRRALVGRVTRGMTGVPGLGGAAFAAARRSASPTGSRPGETVDGTARDAGDPPRVP
jgi:UPF0716 protein FxsA